MEKPPSWGNSEGTNRAIQQCIQPSPQAVELSPGAQLTGEGFAGQGGEGSAFPNPDKTQGLALQRRLDGLTFHGSISMPCIFWPHQTSQFSGPCSLPLPPLIHLLPVWLKIFASVAEHLHASVSLPVKRRLRDAPASLEGFRHWEMTDIWGMLWAQALPPLFSAHTFYQGDCQPYRHHYPHPRNEGKEPGTDTDQRSTIPKVNFSDISPNGWTKCCKDRQSLSVAP